MAACTLSIFFPLRHEVIVEWAARAQFQVLAVPPPAAMSIVLRVFGLVLRVLAALTYRACTLRPPILTWILDQTPRTLRQQLAFS